MSPATINAIYLAEMIENAIMGEKLVIYVNGQVAALDPSKIKVVEWKTVEIEVTI